MFSSTNLSVILFIAIPFDVSVVQRSLSDVVVLLPPTLSVVRVVLLSSSKLFVAMEEPSLPGQCNEEAVDCVIVSTSLLLFRSSAEGWSYF